MPTPSKSTHVNPLVPSSNGETALVELARGLFLQGNLPESIEAYEQATALAPHRTDLLAELGNAWQEMNEPVAALDCYRRAVQADPDNIVARQNLGYLLTNFGEPDLALEQFDELLIRWPSPISQILAATVLPVIYDSAESLRKWRSRFTEKVQELADAGLQADTTRSQIPTKFLLAYQAENDRDLARLLGSCYRGCHLVEKPSPQYWQEWPNRRIRIGFLSAFFHDHTIGRLNLGTVQHLSRERFEVVVLSAGTVRDSWSAAFEQAADDYVVVPRDVQQARFRIANEHLDVIVFSDVGMDAVTSTLAHSRMAPVQCVAWGHPETTGSSAMDYFLSGDPIEPPDGNEHYTEQLVRLNRFAVYYHRPQFFAPSDARRQFGFAATQHIYLCPQTLYKFHPDFDAVLAAILRDDPQAELVLIEGRIANWTERLKRRLDRTLPDATRRVRFLPSQDYQNFLTLLSAADVILDTLHFSGGNTSYEALALGLPIVTLPGAFMRGRITYGLYSKMKLMDMVVHSVDEYVRKAVRLGTDRQYNNAMRNLICSRNQLLFEDRQELTALEQFLLSLPTKNHGQ